MTEVDPKPQKEWSLLTFDEAVVTISDGGKRVNQSEYLPAGLLPVIDQGEQFIGGYTNEVHKKYEGPLPVVIFGDHTRRVKFVNFNFVVGAQGVKILNPRECWEPRFFAYLLGALPIQDRGYSRHYQFIRKLQFPCPSLSEQHQILAEIDKEFTRVDAGVSALKRMQANLKRYRASVLKTACEGRLVPTEAELALQEGRTYELADVLLQRILKERSKKVTEASRRGKDKRNAASPDSQPLDASLQKLPEGWTWSKLDQIGFVIGGLTKNPKRTKLPKQYPYLRVANVYANKLRLDEIEYIGVNDTELEKLLLQTGDLLIVEGNGSKDQIGRLAIWDDQIINCVHQNHIIKVRLVDIRLSLWALYWLLSPVGRSYIEQVASSTSGLYTLSVSKVGFLPIPLPPLTEQQRIISEIERRLSVIDELEAVVATNLKRAERLRQVILHKAFTGQLV